MFLANYLHIFFVGNLSQYMNYLPLEATCKESLDFAIGIFSGWSILKILTFTYTTI